ncbi:DNA-3-methyladenine glycosylase 1 [Galdieria sulphuraria]|uniref:DNA-3-methyladenine glycosylase II n=1 Tax=Galdieria sulphuraria TaxID=130081 RepID=M2VT25_GALSU|nr:DNA-3-methyladenine glycosylase II [Galdieria sulphuraria]EME26316.1 DNA-3-methyladenine glycosylase II [Galdieria sulphuraria]GJD06507.1 DNA-3-methyladenine glycosylase 1 [Galdieria sulphuraria]|eukprot:XP_005702836.1 DNA-3-methyladenine glycosylase II [Galdieria sulphuraria]
MLLEDFPKKRRRLSIRNTKEPHFSTWLQLENKFANHKELLSIAYFLCQQNESWIPLIAEYGLPHLERQLVFPSLIKAIVSQQLSGKAAKAIMERLHSLLQGTVTEVEIANRIVNLEQAQLRQAGLSQRKVEYLKGLAQLFADGTLSDDELASLSDHDLTSRLLTVKGIGEWTIHMLMIFALQRKDVLPFGDLGVRKGAIKFFGLSDQQKRWKKKEEWEALFEPYRPYRTYVSWLMWKVNSPQFVIAME